VDQFTTATRPKVALSILSGADLISANLSGA
jgi:hypothetical protein